MRKSFGLAFAIASVVFCTSDFAKAQSSFAEIVSGTTIPTEIKTSTITSRVAATIASVCDAPDIRVFPSAWRNLKYI